MLELDGDTEASRSPAPSWSALAASGLTALVTGTRSRAFDDTTLQLVAAG